MQVIQRFRLYAMTACATLAASSILLGAQQQQSTTATAPPAQQQATPAPAANVSTIPSPPPTPETLGDAMMAQKRYQAAIEAYKKAPPSATVWNKMGIAYQMMYNLDEAERCYKKSLKLHSKSVTVLNNLGTVYDSQKKYKKAEKPLTSDREKASRKNFFVFFFIF